MAETRVNVADEFETNEKEISVLLLNRKFEEGILDEGETYLLLHAEDNTNWPNKWPSFPYWKYTRFDLGSFR